MKDEILFLNYFEIGVIMGSIRPDAWDQMPRSLWLKLHILSTRAYLQHDKFGKQAKADIEKWEKELKEIEQGGEVITDGSKKS